MYFRLIFLDVAYIDRNIKIIHPCTGMMDVANPFKLNFIKNMLRSDFDTVGPCVVMAAPGFMQVHVLYL